VVPTPFRWVLPTLPPASSYGFRWFFWTEQSSGSLLMSAQRRPAWMMGLVQASCFRSAVAMPLQPALWGLRPD
jgi:hypothetical protein